MFGRRVTLFRLFGFEIRIDWSWLIIAVLITWSLAQGVFPTYYEGLAASAYWWMGVAGALGLFASVVAHELSHSLVARRFGLTMRGITLFIFGGVAEMEEEPQNAKAEFWMAVAGPAMSVLVGLAFYGLSLWSRSAGWPVPLAEVIAYLWPINLVLAAFNLLPAFPLDGGRVLRSVLWARTGRLQRATRIASVIGSGFGFALIGLGVFFAVRGDVFGGIWWALIGLFLRGASQVSYQRLLARRALQGEPVRRFMKPDPVTVPSFISVEQFVEETVYRHHFQMYPIIDEGKFSGCITTRDVKAIPRHEWAQHTVRELAGTCSVDNTISPDADATEALARMTRTGTSRLMVVQGDALVGILTLKDLLQFFALKVDLEGRQGMEKGD